MEPEENNDLEEVKAYFYSHFDCPECGNEVIVEGDVRGEQVECDCGCRFIAV